MGFTTEQSAVLSELANQLLADKAAIVARQAEIDADEVAAGEQTIEAQNLTPAE